MFSQIDAKKQILDSLRPFSAEQVLNLKKTYDAELTYHSNAIEGSTLSLNETKLILNEGITVGGKKLSEHLEAINHKDAIDFIESLSHKAVNELTQADLKNIHYLILKGVDTKNAGAYRTQEVGVKKQNGEIYKFCNPLKIQEEIDALFKWLTSANNLHPIELASMAHLKFVTIHPFIDGNGRTARLLQNLMLFIYGYPLFAIKIENRLNYINAIEVFQIDGNLTQYIGVILNELNATLDSYLQILQSDIKLI